MRHAFTSRCRLLSSPNAGEVAPPGPQPAANPVTGRPHTVNSSAYNDFGARQRAPGWGALSGVDFTLVDQAAKCRGSITGLLWQIPTIFGRLVLLASAWEVDAQRYRHPIIERAFSEQTTHDAFRRLHEEVFEQWMQLTESQRSKDLARYMHSGSLSESAMVDLWINTQMYKGLLPSETSPRDREVFVRDLAVLLISMAARLT